MIKLLKVIAIPVSRQLCQPSICRHISASTTSHNIVEEPTTMFESWQKQKKHALEREKGVAKRRRHFDDIPRDQRSRETFEKAIGTFLHKNNRRVGQVEFIYAALRQMKAFGVDKDLEAYKSLLNIFPKGKMVPTNKYQSDFHHFPKHQDCCLDVLNQMNALAVYPDKEAYDIVRNVFGEWTDAMRKMKRMMYWMPKIKNINPYPLPRPLPIGDAMELARLALERMSRDPAHAIDKWFTEELESPLEKTWILSSQSPMQQNHIVKHNPELPLYVDGPLNVWVGDQSITYFLLLADPDPRKVFHEITNPLAPPSDEDTSWTKSWETKFNKEMPKARKKALIEAPTMHEQPEGTILALSSTGTSSKDSLLMWIGFLQRANPALVNIPVVFRMKHSVGGSLVPQDSNYVKPAEPDMESPFLPPVDLRTIKDI